MQLKDIIKISFVTGGTFHTNEQIEKIITQRYQYNMGPYINSRVMREAGIQAHSKKIKGKTYRGFVFFDLGYSNEQVEAIYNSQKPMAGIKSPEEVHKKIRFLIRDWEILPLPVQLAFKNDRNKYLSEILRRVEHKTEWFHRIINELPGLVLEGKDQDFVLMPSGVIIKHLHEQGVLKSARRPDSDKVNFILMELDYVRINDYVYGKLILHDAGGTLPDW